MTHPARGLTLVELLITLSIAAILAAIGAPALYDFIRNAQLGSQAGDLVSALALARSEAVRQNRRVTFCRSDAPTANPATCTTGNAGPWLGWIVWADANADNQAQTTEVIKLGQVTNASMQVRSSAAIATAGNTINFGGDSLARDGAGALINGQIRVCIPTPAGKNVRDVEISMGGKTGTTFNTSESCDQPENQPPAGSRTGNPI